MRYFISTCLIAGLMAASLYAQSEKPALDVRAYEKDHWGFTLAVPESWNVYREVDVPDEFRVSFGMPKIWSEKENTRIENAVSVSVYRSEMLKTVDDVVRLELARIADILLNKKEVASENGIVFDSRTRINRLEYVSRTICRHANGLGYVICFTATDGTFSQNLPAFENFVTNASFEQPTETPQHLRDRNHYDLAREYYKFGPSHAKKVIAELQKHVALKKDDEKALILLGITQKGIGLFDDALQSFGEAERIVRKSKSIKPRLFMLRAECHFHKKEFQKAHDILKPMWAFFQNDERQKAQYEALMSSIIERLDKSDK